MKYVFTKSEWEAWLLLNQNSAWLTTTQPNEFIETGNKIIELAERIKSERQNQIRHYAVNT